MLQRLDRAAVPTEATPGSHRTSVAGHLRNHAAWKKVGVMQKGEDRKMQKILKKVKLRSWLVKEWEQRSLGDGCLGGSTIC